MVFKRRPDMFLKFQELRQKLQHRSICVKLVKVQSHSDISENDMVDQLARDLAHKIVIGELVAPLNVTVDDAYKIASEISMKSWQLLWDNSGTGRYTYDLTPTAGTKVMFPNCRDTGISYCRMLLNDTQLKYDSHRTGTSDTPQFNCVTSDETIEQFLLHCCKYDDERQEMMDYIKDTGCGQNTKGSLCVSESLLLALPSAGNCVSKKDDMVIKEGLFEFLAKTKRSI